MRKKHTIQELDTFTLLNPTFHTAIGQLNEEHLSSDNEQESINNAEKDVDL